MERTCSLEAKWFLSRIDLSTKGVQKANRRSYKLPSFEKMVGDIVQLSILFRGMEKDIVKC